MRKVLSTFTDTDGKVYKEEWIDLPDVPAPSVPVEQQLKATNARQEFLEECISELANKVYSE